MRPAIRSVLTCTYTTSTFVTAVFALSLTVVFVESSKPTSMAKLVLADQSG
jgi:hypothetical protein